MQAMRVGRAIGIGLAALALPAGAARAAALEAPRGPLVERNIDLAAEKAIDGWIAGLQAAPHMQGIRNIGVVGLRNDARDFTEVLAAKLSVLKAVHVTILGGPDWQAIEDEVARTDPNEGIGDIMDKASTIWTNKRDNYVIAETAQGADALLLGRVRTVDTDWLRARVRLIPYLARVDTRQQVGGSVAEGESLMTVKDLVIYYKVQLAVAAGALIALIVVVGLLRAFARATTRQPR